VRHITVTESEEPIELPDHDGLLELALAVRDLQVAFRARAEQTHTRGDWGAQRFLDSAAYYLWGAMGELAREEGLLSS
jgi:hypothetical protein